MTYKQSLQNSTSNNKNLYYPTKPQVMKCTNSDCTDPKCPEHSVTTIARSLHDKFEKLYTFDKLEQQIDGVRYVTMEDVMNNFDALPEEEKEIMNSEIDQVYGKYFMRELKLTPKYRSHLEKLHGPFAS